MKKKPVVGQKIWRGDMGDGTKAPICTDKTRLDFLNLYPGVVKNLKSGVQVVGIEVWQPGLRPAIDAAIERLRRQLIDQSK